MRELVVALGSNLGDPAALLQQGVNALVAADGIRLDAVSPVYRTVPVGGPDQADYLNAVAVGTTSLSDADLLAAVGAVEAAAGRVRDVRWGPRSLDVDVVAMGDHVSADPALTVPHPRAHQRAFVLVPWLAVRPDATLPGLGPVADLLAALDTSGVTRTDLRLVLGDASSVQAAAGGSTTATVADASRVEA